MTPTVRRVARLAFAALIIGAGTAAAQTKVYPWPGDPSWSPWTVAGGTAEITGDNPNYGNGSLSLGTTSGLFDWGFYVHTSGQESWGTLGEISALSFEWYRTSVTPTDPNLPYIPSWPDAPWMAQTPVLRLLLGQTIGDQLVMSELVWEKWYTDGSPTTNDAWVSADLMSQNFWHNVGGTQYWVNSQCAAQDGPFIPDGQNPPQAWDGGLLLRYAHRMNDGTFADGPASAWREARFSLSDAEVSGSHGVGSNWPANASAPSTG
jgi:hypothetical protein